jgi:lysophospholipase L1-like esterase
MVYLVAWYFDLGGSVMFAACRVDLLVLALLAPSYLAPVKAPALQKGERIVFLGDSITEAGNKDKGYVALIRNSYKEHHPGLGVEIVGAGVSGNKVPDIQKRLEKDVLAARPTMVVIYIGINDVWHGETDPARGTSKEKYEAGLKDVITRIKAAGSKVILCTPTVIGEMKDGKNKNDKKLDEYAEIGRDVAKETKVQLCDLHKVFVDYLKEHNKDNKKEGVLTTDGVHLNDAGNELVANSILKCLGEGPGDKDKPTGKDKEK